MKNYASTLRTAVNFKQGAGEKTHPLEQRLSANICALESFGKITIDQELAATLFMDALDTIIQSKILTETHNHAVNEVKDFPSSVSEVVIRIENYVKSATTTDVKQHASSTIYAFGDDMERENDTSIKPCFNF